MPFLSLLPGWKSLSQTEKGKKDGAGDGRGPTRTPRERVRGEGVTNGSFVLIRKKLVNLPTWALGKRERGKAGLVPVGKGGRENGSWGWRRRRRRRKERWR